jgi:hypothetical protein
MHTDSAPATTRPDKQSRQHYVRNNSDLRHRANEQCPQGPAPGDGFCDWIPKGHSTWRGYKLGEDTLAIEAFNIKRYDSKVGGILICQIFVLG